MSGLGVASHIANPRDRARGGPRRIADAGVRGVRGVGQVTLPKLHFLWGGGMSRIDKN